MVSSLTRAVLTCQVTAMSSKKNRGDERFLRVQKDPRFWEMPERERKIKIDERFRSMFHDRRFKVTHTVDKRGRPIGHTSTEDLRRFYKVSDSEDEDGRSKEKVVDGGGWCPARTHARMHAHNFLFRNSQISPRR